METPNFPLKLTSTPSSPSVRSKEIFKSLRQASMRSDKAKDEDVTSISSEDLHKPLDLTAAMQSSPSRSSDAGSDLTPKTARDKAAALRAQAAAHAMAQKKKRKEMKRKFENVDLFDLSNEVRNNVTVHDRTYLFKIYPMCFVGKSMAVYLVQSGICADKEEAEYLGNMLLTAGIIFHVCDEHEFKAERLFYRFHIDERSDASNEDAFIRNIDATIDIFLKTVPISDKEFQAKTFKNVFSGAEAIDVFLKTEICKNRGEGIKLAQYFITAGLFRHVSNKRDFKDDKTAFYRLCERKGGAADNNNDYDDDDGNDSDGTISVASDLILREKRSGFFPSQR